MLRKEKESMRHYYDTSGWHKNAECAYNAIAVFVDMRPVLDWYRHQTHMRVKRFLIPHGEYFLDAGSGAIPHPEHLAYSSSYNRCVCVDLSVTGLMEARSKLKEKGLCVVADLAKLPFKDNVFGATFSGHVLYHVPKDEQEHVVMELYRTLAPGSKCVIVYHNPHGLLTAIAAGLTVWRRIFKLDLKKKDRQDESTHVGAEPHRTQPKLYLYAYDYQWFHKTFPKHWNIDIRSWCSVGRAFTERVVPNNWIGGLLMKMIFWCETLFPHTLGRLGRYPMIVLRKM